MYIRPKLLWWGIPAFLLLFLLGVSLGLMGNRGEPEAVNTVQADGQQEAEELRLVYLLDQLTNEKERSFLVSMKDYTLEGTYEQERFHLSGEIGGHQLEMKRDDQKQVTVLIDGELQDHTALPYALYTPHEHAQLLKGVLNSLQATPVQSADDHSLRGYRLSVPAHEVTLLLDMWLGPSFPVKEMHPEIAKQIAVQYTLWYDGVSEQVRELDVELRMATSAGEKHDILRFRL
ncbi:hypothetical protein ACAF76_011780 [Brevibacillus sp. TJ4]|uniref:hypothetical protein n=1 Tax=Brevibacillus sp. TJ4 TaxID=3234853 RepID=UPI0037CFC707